jgi:hypothetical protein
MMKYALLLVTLLFSINVFSVSFADLNRVFLDNTDQKATQDASAQFLYTGRDISFSNIATDETKNIA